MVLPNGPNERWSLDFVSDALKDGRRFRIFVEKVNGQDGGLTPKI